MSVKPKEVDAPASNPAGEPKTKSFDHVGVMIVEVARPGSFGEAERIGACPADSGEGDFVCTGRIGEDDRVDVQEQQQIPIADVEQCRIGSAACDLVEQWAYFAGADRANSSPHPH